MNNKIHVIRLHTMPLTHSILTHNAICHIYIMWSSYYMDNEKPTTEQWLNNRMIFPANNSCILHHLESTQQCICVPMKSFQSSNILASTRTPWVHLSSALWLDYDINPPYTIGKTRRKKSKRNFDIPWIDSIHYSNHYSSSMAAYPPIYGQVFSNNGNSLPIGMATSNSLTFSQNSFFQLGFQSLQMLLLDAFLLAIPIFSHSHDFTFHPISCNGYDLLAALIFHYFHGVDALNDKWHGVDILLAVFWIRTNRRKPTLMEVKSSTNIVMRILVGKVSSMTIQWIKNQFN